jgi:hypothetical protein
MHSCAASSPRAKGPATCQPRATPWVIGEKTNKALKGRAIAVPPLQGFVYFGRDTQGGARSSLALGWLVQGLWPSMHRASGIFKSAISNQQSERALLATPPAVRHSSFHTHAPF